MQSSFCTGRVKATGEYYLTFARPWSEIWGPLHDTGEQLPTTRGLSIYYFMGILSIIHSEVRIDEAIATKAITVNTIGLVASTLNSWHAATRMVPTVSVSTPMIVNPIPRIRQPWTSPIKLRSLVTI
jgi:hypothetical protein